MNEELVKAQKEKGVERFDPKKKEEEIKQKIRKDENELEKQKRKEARDKRREEGRKVLGLEIFKNDDVEEYRKKVKSEIEATQLPTNNTQAVQIKAPSDTQQLKAKKIQIQNQHFKDLIAQQKVIQEEEKEQVDKKKLLKEQQAKRKLEQQQKQKIEESKEQKKQENMNQLEQRMKEQKDEYLKKKQLQMKMKDQQDKLQKEIDLEEKMESKSQKKKKKKSQEANKENKHKDQLNELRNWIDDQMKEEQLKSENDQDQIDTESKNLIEVSVQKKSASKQIEETELSTMKPINMPGNYSETKQDKMKYGVRDNRLGLQGDNGYGNIAYKKKQDLSGQDKKKINQFLIGKMMELQGDKKTFKDLEKSKEVLNINIGKQDNRKLIIAKSDQVKQDKQKDMVMPGVLNIEKELLRQKLEKDKKEQEAVVVIQKWTRGFLSRVQQSKKKQRNKDQIESEYSYFEDRIKFNSDYNLEKFLREKQKMREINKTDKIGVSSQEIVEKINYDGSISQSKSGQFGQKPLVKVQNYFNEIPGERDPLSLITAYAKNHMGIVPMKQRPLNKKSPSKIQGSSGSELAEEIYSEDFDEEKSFKKISQEDIQEDIIEGSKENSSSGNNQMFLQVHKQKDGHFNYKAQQSITESIHEELASSLDKRSKRSQLLSKEDSYIAEESNLHKQSENSSRKKSQFDDSIKEEYDHDEFESYEGSIQKPNKQMLMKKEMDKFEKQQREKDGDRKQKVNEMLKELQRYEQATVSTIVVERMEKIIQQSLNQKDKLIVAQRFYELEKEKKHSEEINKIREEQIKLMSQLMLLGGTGSQNVSQQERQAMLENIQKIVDKPIVIEKSKSEESDQIYEEQEEQDYIAESKNLHLRQSDEIKESLEQEEGDDIEEELDFERQSESEKMSMDEIKESLYADGKKVEDKSLSKMRMAFGSEESLRNQSKKTLKEDQKVGNKKQSGLFEKSSFQDFTYSKFKELMFDQDAIDDFIGKIEQGIQEKEIKEKKKLQKELHKKEISPRTFNRRQQELEKWVSEERKQLKIKQSKVVSTCQEMGTFLNKLQKEKKIMVEKIGSARKNTRLLDSLNSQSSLDYDEIYEESNESIKMREARNQIKNLQKHQQKRDNDKALINKKVTAKKLMEEKERAIQEGIKQKMKHIHHEHTEQLLQTALNLDVHAEVDRRIRAASKLMEESNQTSQYYESSYKIPTDHDEHQKQKKKVVFASQDKYSSVADSISHSDNGTASRQYYQNQRVDDSIGESIRVEDSIGSYQHPLQASYKNQSNQGIKESIKESYIKESIKESYNEDYSSSNKYSEDFQSQVSEKKSQRSQKSAALSKQQMSEADAEESGRIEYSMNFEEESMASFNNKRLQQSQKNISVVNEEDENQESHATSSNYQRHDQSMPKETELEEDHFEGSGSVDASSKLQSSSLGNQNQNKEGDSSDDKEVAKSSGETSVEWHYNYDQVIESQRSAASRKLQSSDSEKYQSDFEQINEVEEMDNLDDLESFPEDMSQSIDDTNMRADRIVNDLMKMLMNEVKEDQEFVLEKEKFNEEDFAHKFPWNLKPQDEQIKVISQPKQVGQVQKEPIKVNQSEDQIKEKFEKESNQVKQTLQEVEQYVDLMIKNIDRKELIQSLERPIENDPLKTLQRIQALDSEESNSFNNDSILGGQMNNQILSLDHFKLIETLYRAKFERGSLTESGEQRKIKFDNFHHKSIFDAFNEGLDQERPYKMRGQPSPWSKQTRSVQQKISQAQAEKVLQKARNRVLVWARTGAGTKIAPLPPPPPVQNDFDQPVQQNITTEEDRRNGAREEKLGELLTKEIEENDYLWIEYENEDTQVKFDLADMILEELAQEVSKFLVDKLN